MKKLLFLLTATISVAGVLSAQPCLPEIKVFNGLVVNVGPVDNNGDQVTDAVGAWLRASDFLHSAANPCGNNPLKITITPVWSPGPGNDTTIFFGLPELGTQPVRIWADDGNGHVCFVETYVLIWDDSNWESNPDPQSPTGCSPDLIPPTLVLLNGLSASFLPDGNGAGSVKLLSNLFVRRRSDNCGDAAVSRDRLTKSDFIFSGSLPRKATQTYVCPDELGVSLVEVYSEDVAGNIAHPATYILLQDGNDICTNNNIVPSCAPDNVPPLVFLYNGLATHLKQNLSVTVTAEDFICKMSDNCGGINSIRISNGGTVNTPPVTTSLTFDCSSLGVQPVDIWVSDAAGNWSRTTSFVRVQSNCNSCSPAPRPAQGNPRYWPAYLDQLLGKPGEGRQ